MLARIHQALRCRKATPRTVRDSSIESGEPEATGGVQCGSSGNVGSGVRLRVAGGSQRRPKSRTDTQYPESKGHIHEGAATITKWRILRSTQTIYAGKLGFGTCPAPQPAGGGSLDLVEREWASKPVFPYGTGAGGTPRRGNGDHGVGSDHTRHGVPVDNGHRPTPPADAAGMPPPPANGPPFGPPPRPGTQCPPEPVLEQLTAPTPGVHHALHRASTPTAQLVTANVNFYRSSVLRGLSAFVKDGD